jgi:hypothetical protein
VSTTPKNHASLASMTLGRNVSLMSMTPESDAFAVLEYFTAVNNTAEKLLACVTTWHRRPSPVSMTPLSSDFALSITLAELERYHTHLKPNLSDTKR